MSLRVQDFRSKLKGDGARPSLFRIKLSAPGWVGFPSEKLSFMANAASLPSSPLGVVYQSYMGQDIKVPGDRTYPDWDITVINDEDFDLRDGFERWNNGMSQYTRNDGVRVNGASTNPNSYTGTATVEHFSKDGNTVIKKYILYNIWPNVVSPINLAWGAKDQIENFGVSFSYDYFESVESTD